MPRQHPRAEDDEEEVTTAARHPAALRALVAGLVDYAGLFPPASLGMPAAAACYAEYRRSPDAWMLGRFIVPVTRLDELAAALPAGADAPWALGVLVGDDIEADAARLTEFGATHRGRFTADVVELRASDIARIALAARTFRADRGVTAYVELPYVDDPGELLLAVRQAGLRAKVRTGGVTADAFPTAAQLARFIARCAEVGVPFKATAGLHHPLRGEHRLTYQPDAPAGTMFGFLNVFIAAALANVGVADDELVNVLEERDAAAFTFTERELRWRERSIPLTRIQQTRDAFATAFGSCSFREPVDHLQELARP
jgi:hypothetical protein